MVALDVGDRRGIGQVERADAEPLGDQARRAPAAAHASAQVGRVPSDAVELAAVGRDSAAPGATATLSAGSCDEAADEAISAGRASSSRYSSVHRLSDATLSAALAAKSDADTGMDAPPFGAIADHVLIAVVERIGDAQVELDRVGDAIGDARARQPIGVEPHPLGREDVEVGVEPLAGIGDAAP